MAHRDLKPANVMLSFDRKYKLIDFGISTTVIGSQRTNSRTLVGTPKFMAPELLNGFLLEKTTWEYNPFKSDCFSFGMILLELVANKSEEISGLNRNIESAVKKKRLILAKVNKHHGKSLRDIIEKMIQFDPNDRPSYQDLKVWLKNYKSREALEQPSLLESEASESLLTGYKYSQFYEVNVRIYASNLI